jgi:hypothetical protein
MRWSLILLALTCSGALGFAARHSQSEPDDYVRNRVAVIDGRIEILNHPDLGRTPASGQYLVFQRVDCKDCLVATRADADGNYRVFVGVGKYKVIIRDSDGPTLADKGYDLLDADQPRYVEANSVGPSHEFNIQLRIPDDLLKK